MTISNDGLKTCKVCGEQKIETLFPSIKGGKYRGGTCNACRWTARNERELARGADATRADRAAAKKKYMASLTPERRRELKQGERYRRAQRDGKTIRPRAEHLALVKAQAAERQEQKQEQARIEREQELAARIELKPWTDPKLTPAEAFKMRYRQDESFRREQIERTKRRKAENGRFAEKVRGALRKQKRSPTIERAIGYSLDDLRAHLESLFEEGMTWEVFFAGAIHIDHRRPVSTWDLNDPDQLREAWSLDNVQPLWASDNIRKGTKWEGTKWDGDKVDLHPDVDVDEDDLAMIHDPGAASEDRPTI